MREKLKKIVSRCDSNCLQLNTKKTKEMISDFRNIQYDPPTLIIKGEDLSRSRDVITVLHDDGQGKYVIKYIK